MTRNVCVFVFVCERETKRRGGRRGGERRRGEVRTGQDKMR